MESESAGKLRRAERVQVGGVRRQRELEGGEVGKAGSHGIGECHARCQAQRVGDVTELQIRVEQHDVPWGGSSEAHGQVARHGRLAGSAFGGEHHDHPCAVLGIAARDQVRSPAMGNVDGPLDPSLHLVPDQVGIEHIAHARPQCPLPDVRRCPGGEEDVDLGSLLVERRGDPQRPCQRQITSEHDHLSGHQANQLHDGARSVVVCWDEVGHPDGGREDGLDGLVSRLGPGDHDDPGHPKIDSTDSGTVAPAGASAGSLAR